MKKLLALMLSAVSLFAQNTYIEKMMGTVPNSATSITTRTTYVQLLICSASSTTTLTVTDTAGNIYFNAIAMTANQTTLVYTAGGNQGNTGIKMVGIKWSAGNTNALVCQLQGVQP